MILQSLYQAYGRLKDDPTYMISPNGYSFQKITFKVVLTEEGELFEIQDARVSQQGKLRPNPVQVLGTTKPSGRGINPCFLWDKREYMLGYSAQDEKAAEKQRIREKFLSFRNLHLGLEAKIAGPAFIAVCRFLEDWDPELGRDHPVLEDAAITGFGVFQIQGETNYVHENRTVKRWWDTEGKSKWRTNRPSTQRGQCLVTGDEATLARIHPKIKGVSGAQTAGATIVGFNEDAYQSYGKEQSYNGPVSEEVALRYTATLNALLEGPQRFKHRTTLGDTTVVFWTERSTLTEDIFLPFIAKGSGDLEQSSVQDEGMRQKLQSFLQALRDGYEAYAEIEQAPEQTSYFILGLAPNAARIAIRFFYQGTLAELLANVRQHHRDIGLVPQPAKGNRRADPEFPPAWLLLKQVCRDGDAKEIPPILSGPLMRAIITGTYYPAGLYMAILRRLNAGGRIQYLRASVIKGYLNRNLNKEVSMALDPTRVDRAYLLGRLFAALEKTQKDALGEGLNKTIRDSFYSSASSTPGPIFPRLLRKYQHHLAKLEGGHRINREKLIQEIFAPLLSFPAQLSLSDQGLFAMGYYHQIQDFYKPRGDSATNQTETS